MSDVGLVYYNGILAGRLERKDREFVFTYDDAYLADASLPPIALSFSKTRTQYRSPVLFPFFHGLLAEGGNKQLQCSSMKIDERDHFTRLIKTAGETTIGAVTVREES